jgi:hypothetical protein
MAFDLAFDSQARPYIQKYKLAIYLSPNIMIVKRERILSNYYSDLRPLKLFKRDIQKYKLAIPFAEQNDQARSHIIKLL